MSLARIPKLVAHLRFAALPAHSTRISSAFNSGRHTDGDKNVCHISRFALIFKAEKVDQGREKSVPASTCVTTERRSSTAHHLWILSDNLTLRPKERMLRSPGRDPARSERLGLLSG